VRRLLPLAVIATVAALSGWLGPARAVVCNVKVVSDSTPDFTDVDSLLASTTGSYQTTDDKCRALWRWIARSRRQTPQPYLHGTPVHDPIMFFNDFGYSFCSDYAAINDALWHAMGLPVRLWDITNHTVSECFYDNRWHLFDNSLSAYYTLCDGKTVAGVEDIGRQIACPASGGKAEKGHVAKYHCAAATSPNGFLSGCDTQRSLQEEGEHVFNPNGLKLRDYYTGFELGHRYLLDLRANESYTRYTRPLGKTADYYLPLPGEGASPQDLGTFGNGEWLYKPDLTKDALRRDVYQMENVAFTRQGMKARDPSKPGWVMFRISAANIITKATVTVHYTLAQAKDAAGLAYSTNWGMDFKGQSARARADTKPGPRTGELVVRDVAGLHEYLVKAMVEGNASITGLSFHTLTQLNRLALPALSLGTNTIDVTTGKQTEALQIWPEIQNGKFKDSAYFSENVASGRAEEWHGCLYLDKPGTGNVQFLVETPNPMLSLTFGGRFYNRAPGSSIVLQYSFDDGKTWKTQWALTDTAKPWDVVHFETVAIPTRLKRALVRYVLNSPVAGTYEGCSLYSVRIAAEYRPVGPVFEPLEVTYNWSELHGDAWVERSHTQLISLTGQRYTLRVGGDDTPRLNWIRVNVAGAAGPAAYGYSDGKEEPPAPRTRVRHLWGPDLALGKKYTFSVPSAANWEAGDPGMTKLTDGVVASTYGGGSTYRWGPIWPAKANPVITVDLKEPQTVAAVRLHVTGYPYDLYRGPYCTVEVLTSENGKRYQSQGSFQTKMRAVALDGDFLNQERGGFESLVFPLLFKEPVRARYVRCQITNPDMFFATSEFMAYGSARTEEWREPLVMPLGPVEQEPGPAVPKG